MNERDWTWWGIIAAWGCIMLMLCFAKLSCEHAKKFAQWEEEIKAINASLDRTEKTLDEAKKSLTMAKP